MTQKNLKLVRRVLNSEVWGKVINCPDALMRQARSMNDRARVKAAMTAQIATAVAIVTAAPVRLQTSPPSALARTWSSRRP